MTGVLHLTHDLDPPALHVGRLIAQGLEGDADLDLVAGVGESTLGLKDVIGAEIGRFASRGRDREPLRAADALLDNRAVHLDA